MNVFGFCDLNVISPTTEDKALELCTKLVDLKYKTVAFNTVLDDSEFETKKKKKSEKKSDIVPEPFKIKLPEHLKLNIFYRLTLRFSDGTRLFRVTKSPNFKKYHLFAVIPVNQAALQHACNSTDIDIISYDPESKPLYRLNRKLYKLSIQKSMYFEIMYAPLLTGEQTRKNTIQIGQSYYMFGKSKNTIMTSGGEITNHFRGPYDIIHLGLLFGLSETQAKESVSQNPKAAIYRAGIRARGKAIVKVTVNPEKLDRSGPAIKKTKFETDMDVS